MGIDPKEFLEVESDEPCMGCQRMVMHKFCPAHGTEFYCSGLEYTEEIEQKVKEGRAAGYADIDEFYFDIERILDNERRKKKESGVSTRNTIE